MELVNDLGNEIALAVLLEKKYRQNMDSEELVSFISKIKDALQPVSGVDDSYYAKSLAAPL